MYVCIYIYMGSSINGGTHLWFIMENPIQMDENWGYPYFRNLHMLYAYLWAKWAK